jgi:tetratricopeptide (TPR) repeat protein
MNYNTMTHTFRSMAARRMVMLASTAVFLLSGGALGADDLAEASKLVRQGQYGPAMGRVDGFLAANPRDAQGRFLKGLIFTEQNKTGEAIAVFTKLTEDFPELPEPYNNLAVLYASQGQYDNAKNALEMAIRMHPSYSTAHENLGDVYAKLASQAYGRALQLDGANTTAQTKLALIRDLITVNARAPKPVTRTEPARGATADPAAKPGASAAKPVASPAAATPAPEGSVDDRKSAAGDSEEVAKTLRAWAAAWTAKDVQAYLAFYSASFKTPGGQPRKEWENARKVRIQAPKVISVTLDAIKVKPAGSGSVQVTFRQNYKFDSLESIGTTKTITMTRSAGKWQIIEDRVGG